MNGRLERDAGETDSRCMRLKVHFTNKLMHSAPRVCACIRPRTFHRVRGRPKKSGQKRNNNLEVRVAPFPMVTVYLCMFVCVVSFYVADLPLSSTRFNRVQ